MNSLLVSWARMAIVEFLLESPQSGLKLLSKLPELRMFWEKREEGYVRSLLLFKSAFPAENVELYAARVQNRGLCAIAQAESLRYKLLGGLAVRRACYGVLRYILENGAKGCEIIVSGKLRAQRAKSMKFKDGYMIKSGDAVNHYIDKAVRHIQMKQGVLGIKVAIMLPYDENGEIGPAVRQPDVITILEPKEEEPPPAQGYGQQMQPQVPAQVAQDPQQQMGMAPDGTVPLQDPQQHQQQYTTTEHPQVPQGQMQQDYQQQQYTSAPQIPQQQEMHQQSYPQ